MEFYRYDPAEQVPDWDEPTRNLLNDLRAQFERVEIKQMDATKEWCIRVAVEDGSQDLPFATIGRTLHQAAMRMKSVVTMAAASKVSPFSGDKWAQIPEVVEGSEHQALVASVLTEVHRQLAQVPDRRVRLAILSEISRHLQESYLEAVKDLVDRRP